jgi:hypothetical protein
MTKIFLIITVFICLIISTVYLIFGILYKKTIKRLNGLLEDMTKYYKSESEFNIYLLNENLRLEKELNDEQEIKDKLQIDLYELERENYELKTKEKDL